MLYNVVMLRKHRKGFTLAELLVVMTIISLLSSIATVSYTSARMKGRDGRRLGDMDAFRTALELYYQNFDAYPSDNNPGADGLVLGQSGATKLSESGFSDSLLGYSYMENVSRNPIGGGADYIYRSLELDGTDCDSTRCPLYTIEFVLEAPISGMPAGAYVSDPLRTVQAPPEMATRILSHADQTTIDRIASRAAPLIDSSVVLLNEAKTVIDTPEVRNVAENIVAPVSTAATVFSTATGLGGAIQTASVFSAASGLGSAVQTATTTTAAAASAASAVGQVGALFYLLLTQPLLLLRKRREYAWGVVYDSQKKLPVDLAIVRLIDNATGRVVQTRVTDKVGRIFFFAPKGTYRIEVAKPGFSFPSTTLAGEREDGKFANLYFGQRFTVAGSGQVINPSIPLDPAGADVSDKEFIKRFIRGNLRYVVSVIGITLTAIALAINPSYMVGGLLALNLILFFVFRRISYPKQPAEWGVVRDEKTGRHISHAVVRLFSSPYNKLVETRVTDSRGRYNFIVGQNVFYITATSQGYWKTESYPLDLRGSDKPQIISAHVSMRPSSTPPRAPETDKSSSNE